MLQSVESARKWHSIRSLNYDVLFTVTIITTPSTLITRQPNVTLHATIASGDSSTCTTRVQIVTPTKPDTSHVGYYFDKNGKEHSMTSFLSSLDASIFPVSAVSGDVYFTVPLTKGERFLSGMIRVEL